jgi:hypothetical protein
MSAFLISGAAEVEYYTKTASTTLLANAILSTTSGQLIAGTSTTASSVGISLRGSATGDGYGDFTTATKIPVLVPSQDAIFEMDATGLTAALVDTTMDLTDSVTVNGSADSHHAVTLVKYISATKGWFKINNLKSYHVGA